MKKMDEILYKIAEYICIVFLLMMVIIVVIDVVGRFVFNRTPAWGNEVAVACMIWFGLLSSSLAEHDERHIRVTVMDKVYPKKMVRVLHLIFYFIKLAFAVIVTVNSAKLVKFNRNVYMYGAKISQSWVSLAGFVMGIFMCLFLLLRMKREVLGK